MMDRKLLSRFFTGYDREIMEFSGCDFSRAAAVLEAAVKDGAFPGCAACVGSSRGQAWQKGFGLLGGAGSVPVTPRTLYDLASLTKVAAATAAAMTLVSTGRLRLQAPVRDYLPEFQGEGREAVTVEHLLTHSAGLPAWRPFYLKARGREEVLRAIFSTPLEVPPGRREEYSDLGAILLGECVARAGGKPLATLSWEKVFLPLAMRETFFCPPASERWRIAPTEVDEVYRRCLIHGEVHDENAFAMGGVSGHAGLFSTAGDLRLFAAEMLAALDGRSAIFPQAVAREFTARRQLVPGSTRALGWDTRSEKGSSAGSRFSLQTFGHTGFTGTSLWIDPARQVYAILLSNRVHPTRKNQKIAAVRAQFHDAVVRCLEGRKIERF